MLSGLPEINIEDWRKYTEYSGYDENSPQIKVWNKQDPRAVSLNTNTVDSLLSGSNLYHELTSTRHIDKE
jgi:hypothetical protein